MKEENMLTTQTLDKLGDLNLMGMSRAYQEQMERADYQALPFDDRLGMLVDVELQERENRRLFRYLKAARLRDQACIEDIDFHTPRGLNRALILELGESRWIDAHQNVLVIGATGLGKTYVACALAEAAIRKGHTALYMRFPRMVDELAVARVDGRMPRLLAAWARVDVLVLDDFSMQPLSGQQSADLLEVIEDRSQRRSTILYVIWNLAAARRRGGRGRKPAWSIAWMVGRSSGGDSVRRSTAGLHLRSNPMPSSGCASKPTSGCRPGPSTPTAAGSPTTSRCARARASSR
jgi:DNA replication protein DnaC